MRAVVKGIEARHIGLEKEALGQSFSIKGELS